MKTNLHLSIFSFIMTGLVLINVSSCETIEPSVKLANSISTVNIPAGTFTMGSPTSEGYIESDETQHSVTLSAFRMSKYEISNEQYAEFLNANNIGIDGLFATGTYPTEVLVEPNADWGLVYSGSQWIPVKGYKNNPVINVSWFGAVEFATYVGGMLPTEAQWEYACRAGTTTPFNTGSCISSTYANYNWIYLYRTCSNSNSISPNKTQTVGSYAANPWGLYDMHGNVWEWCKDWYGKYSSSSQTNPTGPSTGSYRVGRGGSWNADPYYCRAASRALIRPEDRTNYVGFRLVFIP